MAIYKLGTQVPSIAASAFVAREATVIGQVKLSEGTSVWPGASVSGENATIEVGPNSNVQEGAVLHADPGMPLHIGAGVTVGHQAMLHGCTIGDNCLIGIQAVVLNGAVIGKNSLVGAGALVTENKVFPDNSLILGSPAKVSRQLDDAAVASLRASAKTYVQHAVRYAAELELIHEGSVTPAE